MRTLLLKIDATFGMVKIINYLIVGGLSALINFASFALLWDFFHINYKIAVTCSYLLAILFNFTSNRFVTFKRRGQYLVPHIAKYITMMLLNYSLTMIIVHMAVVAGISPYFGLIGSIALTAVTGFTLSRFWVFR